MKKGFLILIFLGLAIRVSGQTCPSETDPWLNTRDTSGTLHNVACVDPVSGGVSWQNLRGLGQVLRTEGFPGLNFGSRVTACLAALPTSGAICDAHGEPYSISAPSGFTIPAGDAVFLGPSSLSIGGPIILLSNSTLEGSGERLSTITPSAGYNQSAVLIGVNSSETGPSGSTVTGARVLNLGISFSSGQTAGYAVHLSSVQRCDLSDLWILGNGSEGSGGIVSDNGNLASPAAGTGGVCNFHDIRIFGAAGQAIYNWGESDNRYSGLFIDGEGAGNLIWIRDSGDVQVSHSILSFAGNNGIFIEHSTKINIFGNWIDQYGQLTANSYGVQVGDGSSGAASTWVNVVGNQMFAAASTNSLAGIGIFGVSHAIISGNLIDTSSSSVANVDAIGFANNAFISDVQIGRNSLTSKGTGLAVNDPGSFSTQNTKSGKDGLSTGTISLSAASSGSHTFTNAYTSAPICTATESGTSPGTLVNSEVSSTTTAITITTASAVTATYNWVCSPTIN